MDMGCCCMEYGGIETIWRCSHFYYLWSLLWMFIFDHFKSKLSLSMTSVTLSPILCSCMSSSLSGFLSAPSPMGDFLELPSLLRSVRKLVSRHQALLKLQYAISGMPNMFGCSEILPVGSQNQEQTISVLENKCERLFCKICLELESNVLFIPCMGS